MEELKMILEAVNGMSGDVMTFAIVWILKGVLTDIIFGSILGGLVLGAFKLGRSAINNYELKKVVCNAIEISADYDIAMHNMDRIVRYIKLGMGRE